MIVDAIDKLSDVGVQLGCWHLVIVYKFTSLLLTFLHYLLHGPVVQLELVLGCGQYLQ